MDIGFECNPHRLDIDQSFLLTISTIMTIGYHDDLTPSSYFSFFFYHGIFYVFWFLFCCLLAQIFSNKNSNYYSDEMSISRIIDKKLKILIILHPLRQNPLSKNLLSVIQNQIDYKTTKIIINSEEENYKDLGLKNLHFCKFDLFGDNSAFFNEINKVDVIKYYIFTDPSLQTENYNDYNAILSCSIMRQYCQKAFISAQLKKEEHLFLEWADWDFVMSSNYFRVINI